MEKQMPQSNVEPTPQEKQIDYARIALEKLRSIMDWSPRELYEHLEHLGYVGQQGTRRRLCLMAYRHIRRLKDHYIKNIPLDRLPPKTNVLMVGPTGCGKSYLAELLFGTILQVPVVTFDMTGFVETGYVGKYVNEMLFELIHMAEGNSHWAQMGICVLDEFDKIASLGGRKSRDITGYGVQRGLLKIIEGGLHEVTGRGPWGHQPFDTMETDCVGFVACGAFSGIEHFSVRKNNNSFGFSVPRKHISQGNPENEYPSDIMSVETFKKYGFLPELIGRFSSISCLSPLGKTHLMKILRKNVLPKYRREFKREGQKLSLPKKVMEKIVDKAIQRKTGARGIALLLTEHFEKQAFECFGQNDGGDIDCPGPPF